MKKYILFTSLLASSLFMAQDRNQIPASLPSPKIQIKQPTSFTLPNGLKVLVVENKKLPRVSLTLVLDRLAQREGKVAGVSEIFAQQMGNGTQITPKDEFNSRIDFLGAKLSFSPYGASASTLSRYFPEVFSLFAQAITHPDFNPKEIQKLVDRNIEGIKSSYKSADAISENVNPALIYGRTSSRGEITTEETLRAITPADVTQYYQRVYTPQNAYLVVEGDTNLTQVRNLANKYLSTWKGSAPNNSLEVATAPKKTEINIVDVPTAVQSVITVNSLHNMTMSDPDYIAATVGNFILGGQDGRLFRNLREKQAFTYGAYSYNQASKNRQLLVASSSVRTEVTARAIEEFLKEMKNASSISEADLEKAKAKLKGSFIMSLEDPGKQADFAVNQFMYNLPSNYYQTYLQRLDDLTVDQVQKAMKRVLHPENLRILVVGKASEFKDSIAKLGLPITYFDRNALPTKAPEKPKIQNGITPLSIAERYISAIGGLDNLKKIQSIRTSATGDAGGMKLEIIRNENINGDKQIEIKVAGNTLQKIVFSGNDGFMEAQGKKTPLPPSLLQEFKSNPDIFPELDMYQNPTKYILKGIENYNGEEAYTIVKDNITRYYSKNNGLKIAEVKSMERTPGNVQIIPSTFSDYQVVNGIKMPTKLNQQMMGNDIQFTMKYEFNPKTE